MAIVERFCRYAAIDTHADEDSTSSPSTPEQIEFNKQLKKELIEMGCQEVILDDYGILTATIPANRPNIPVIAWLAHVDTSPEVDSRNVKPQVVPNYQGQVLVLPGDPSQKLDPEEFPELKTVIGHTLITTDGTTLLGSDCKSGLTAIVEAAEHLINHPEIPHGEIRLVFSIDEEIGKGTVHMNPERIKADVAYTLDGGATSMIDCETFSADLAVVTIEGINTHPAHGKGHMVNALTIGADFVSRLPKLILTPETSDGRQGFLHPYSFEGSVGFTEIKIILRDFETEALAQYAKILTNIAENLAAENPRASINVNVVKQYRNMREGLSKDPRALDYAEEAMRRLGINPERTIIRGGTDGSGLTEMGLPTPNLSSGQHNIHSRLEWTSAEEIEQTKNVLLSLAQIWYEHSLD
ncbi:MAG: peptidase T [Candidatus Bruticola sp.]